MPVQRVPSTVCYAPILNLFTSWTEKRFAQLVNWASRSCPIHKLRKNDTLQHINWGNLKKISSEFFSWVISKTDAKRHSHRCEQFVQFSSHKFGVDYPNFNSLHKMGMNVQECLIYRITSKTLIIQTVCQYS